MAIQVKCSIHCHWVVPIPCDIIYKFFTRPEMQPWFNYFSLVSIFLLQTVKSLLSRKCFPAWKRLLCALPGIILAIIGLCIFGFLETDDNYAFTHSAWHVCVSSAIIFLLPKRTIQVKGWWTHALKILLGANSHVSSLCIYRGANIRFFWIGWLRSAKSDPVC